MAATSYQQIYLPERVSWPSCELLQISHGGTIYRPVIANMNEKSFTQKVAERRSSGVKRWEGHTHRFYHVFFYTQGENEITLQNRRHPVGTGTLLCISPGELHNITPHIPRGYSRLELNLKYMDIEGTAYAGSFHELLSHIAGFRMPALSFPIRLSTNAAAAVERDLRRILHVLRERSQTAAMRSRLLLGQFFQTVIEDLGNVREPGTGTEAGGLSRARNHIEDNLATPLSVPDLAAMACISRAHFIRRFREVYGLPPIAYQRRLKVDKAKQLLLYSDLTATEIAEQLGFRTVQYFNRVFTQLTGIAPIRFRRDSQ